MDAFAAGAACDGGCNCSADCVDFVHFIEAFARAENDSQCVEKKCYLLWEEDGEGVLKGQLCGIGCHTQSLCAL